MESEVMDWENAYTQQGVFTGPPPWNIGEPQPELTALIDAGEVTGEVLDAGCGHAELSLALAARGFTVVGIDVAPSAVAAATEAARERGLTGATFVCADITSFTGYDGKFSTIIDSTLFHSLPVEGRDGYLRSIHRAAAHGARYFVLAFAKGAFPADVETKPNEVDEDELRAAVAKYFEVDAIRPAKIHTNRPEFADIPAGAMPFEPNEVGRIEMPAYLLSAHKTG
jgi:SAM-dependent methyltransferase